MDNTSPKVKPGLLVAVLAFTGITAALMQTLVVPLIADLPQMLNTTPSNASWVITVTLLTAAVATPITGRLGDMFGKRRIMLLCTIPLILGSALAAVATSVLPMIIGRGLQGIGAGLIPLGISLMRELLPREKLLPAIGMMSASMGVGGALGLPIAAAVAENFNWRTLFWGTAALSALVAILLWRVIPAGKEQRTTARFDLIGGLSLAVGLVCLLLGVSKGGTWGWTSASTIGLLVGAVLALLAWGLWELRVKDPLVDLRVTARPQVLMTNLASVALGFSMYAQALIVPQLLQLPSSTGYGLGQSMFAMGLWMAPGGFVMMAVSMVGGKLSAAYGPKVTLLCGSVVIAAGYASSMVMMSTAWGLMLVVCFISAGVGLAYGAMPALIMSAVPPSETGSANSFNTLTRSIGTSFAAAVVGVVLAQMSVQVGPYHFPTENGFKVGLLMGAGVALVAAAITLGIPKRKADVTEAAVSEAAVSGAAVSDPEQDTVKAPA